MNQQEELLQIHIETLYVLDDNGDMRATNWPREPGRRRAPAFHLGWTERGYVSCFRHDVPTDRREQGRELVALPESQGTAGEGPIRGDPQRFLQRAQGVRPGLHRPRRRAAGR